MPEAPDRDYVEKSLLECWEANLVDGQEARIVVQEIEKAYRVGMIVADLVDYVTDMAEKLIAQRNKRHPPSAIDNLLSKRNAFKFIIDILTFKISKFTKYNSDIKNFSILMTLNPPKDALFAEYIKSSQEEQVRQYPEIVRIEWLGTQNALAALLATLKQKNWITDFKPYKTLKILLTETDTIDTVLRPDSADGEAIYGQIPKMNFKFFDSIKVNTKSKKIDNL